MAELASEITDIVTCVTAPQWLPSQVKATEIKKSGGTYDGVRVQAECPHFGLAGGDSHVWTQPERRLGWLAGIRTIQVARECDVEIAHDQKVPSAKCFAICCCRHFASLSTTAASSARCASTK